MQTKSPARAPKRASTSEKKILWASVFVFFASIAYYLFIYKDKDSYAFKNPSLASKVLAELDVFEPINPSVFGADAEVDYYHPFYGLKSDDNYCDNHREFIVQNTSIIFEEMNFVVSIPLTTFVRTQVIASMGKDLLPTFGKSVKKEKNQYIYDVPMDAQLFYGPRTIAQYKHVGKHLGCLDQITSNIPGHYAFSMKNKAAEATLEYGKKFQDRRHCFNNDKFFPKTWLLYDVESCKDFFREFNSEEYQKLKAERTIVYVRKIGAGLHRGDDVYPMIQAEEDDLRIVYGNGTLCGNPRPRANVDHMSEIVQYFIHNPLLIKKRKFDFRMYMLVASTNPLIAYYHDGFLRVSIGFYNKSSTDKSILLTNLNFNKGIYDEIKKGNLFDGKITEEELRYATQWSFARLQKYLLENGIISDPNWLDNYLRPEIQKAMIHLLRMAGNKYVKRSTFYELYGVDFILDSNLNLWFLEVNSGVAFNEYTEDIEKMIVKMLEDHWKIVFGLMRSRMKRAIKYVNRLIDSGAAVDNGEYDVKIEKLGEKIAEFRALTRNYFEREFKPERDNSFVKIVDENLEGTARYSGLIPQECL